MEDDYQKSKAFLVTHFILALEMLSVFRNLPDFPGKEDFEKTLDLLYENITPALAFAHKEIDQEHLSELIQSSPNFRRDTLNTVQRKAPSVYAETMKRFSN